MTMTWWLAVSSEWMPQIEKLCRYFQAKMATEVLVAGVGQQNE